MSAGSDRFAHQFANIRQVAGDRRGGCHGGAHQVGTPAAALAAFEVAVRRGRAAFAGQELVGGSSQGTWSSRKAPFEAGVDEDPGQPFFLGLGADEAEPGTTMARLTLILRPFRIAAAARRSSIRPLVQEPMKTVSMAISVSFWPGVRPM